LEIEALVALTIFENLNNIKYIHIGEKGINDLRSEGRGK
jgi:hypothetical protein